MTALFWDFENINATGVVDPISDACLVFINAFAGEGQDRAGLTDTYSDNLVINIANQCNNTIVVIHNAGIRVVDAWIEHPNVTALIYAHLPGQDSGRALVQLLYGQSNAWGKLPYTVAKNGSDYGNLEYHDVVDPSSPFARYPQSNFTEGLYIDYRAFDKYNITPRYEFGFGLSYTTFNYSDISISSSSNTTTSPYPTGPIRQGGQEDLWDTVATVSAAITNTGAVEGKEIAQLYVGIPGGPVRQLRGFEKIAIPAGQKAGVSFELNRRDLSTWDVVAQKWLLQSGEYTIYVGGSSRDLPLTGSLTL